MTASYYSEREPNTLDRQSRLAKAQKIWDVVQDFTRIDMSTWQCLDIGSSGGLITAWLGSKFGQTIGIDVDTRAMTFARSNADVKNVNFVVGSGMDLPFGDDVMDIVICNHIYEHVPSASRLFDEIWRILRPGGVCYLACTNKYWILEPHYHLPFLSWIPRSLSDWYLRITRKGTHYDEQLRSHHDIVALLQEREFEFTEYTLRIIEEPERFHTYDILKQWSMMERIPKVIFRWLWYGLPTFIWMLRKGP